MKILIIEDDALISLFLKECLEDLGHEVVNTFVDAQSTIEFLKTTSCDLAFVDIELKGAVDGLQLSKTLKQRFSTPSLFVTSHKESEVIKEAMDVSPLGFLIKPVEQSDIEAALSVAIRHINIPQMQPSTKEDEQQIGEYSFNFTYKTLKHSDQIIKLSQKEIILLGLLFKNYNNTVSIEEIVSKIWENESVSDETLRQLIYRTRKKITGLKISSSSKIGYSISNV